MSILHIVLFKFKSDLTQHTLSTIQSELVGLQPKLPHLINKLSFGKSFTDRHKGYQHVLTVELGSRDALAEYLSHPEHQRVLKSYLIPNMEDVIAVDV